MADVPAAAREAVRACVLRALEEGESAKVICAGVVAPIPASEFYAHVETEIARAYSVATFRTYEAAGVRRIQWASAADERTCERCRNLDGTTATLGQTFDGTGVLGPPLHLLCRCVTVSA